MRSLRLTDSRPKVSTMPRPQTEATAYLNLYKLAIEKKRLQTELDSIEQRRHSIQKRLSLLESHAVELQQNQAPKHQAPKHQVPKHQVPKHQASRLTPVSKNNASDAALNTLFLEY